MIDWHPADGGEVLHAVPRSEFFVNRNSLCFTLCELPPYPKYLQVRLARRGEWSAAEPYTLAESESETNSDATR